MPTYYIYVYSPDDFVTTPPNEGGGGGVGNNALPYTLELKPGATGTRIAISDDDLLLDEIDTSTDPASQQTLAEAVTIDGTTYNAGDYLSAAYTLSSTDPSVGFTVTSVHFNPSGGSNSGPIDGIVSTQKLVPGELHVFDTAEANPTNTNTLYENFVACFCTGTLIETLFGPRPVESLKEGDMVQLDDGSYKPLRKCLQRKISRKELDENPKLRPIVISAGALGLNLPKRDLRVSRQHRMLTNTPIVQRMFGVKHALISAIKLTALMGIYIDNRNEPFSYHHLVLDQHEIISAEGAPTESLFLGKGALEALSQDQRDELLAIFPDVAEENFAPAPAHLIPSSQQQKRLAMRMSKNNKSALS